MGSYEFDNENYLHYTGDGWITTTRPLSKDEKERFLKGELSFTDFDWE